MNLKPMIEELEEYELKKLSRSKINELALNLLWEKYGKTVEKIKKGEKVEVVEVEFPSPKTDDQWQIKSKGWVGYIPLTPEFVLYLKPKVKVENIFKMWDYAYNFNRFHILEGEINCQFREGFFSRLANVLAKRIIDRERQGLYRDYVPKTDHLTYIRGRIDIQSAIQRPWDIKLKCRYDEQTVDIEDNQILAWTLYIIIHSSLWTEKVRVPQSVRQAYHALQQLVTRKEFKPEDCIGRNYNYLNQDYQLLHSLCRFFLEGTGPSHQIGDRTMLPFLIDMAKLYELFVAEWLKEWLKANPQNRIGIETQYPVDRRNTDDQTKWHFDIDIRLYNINDEKTTLYILDTKYKKSVENDDIKQVIAYAEATHCTEAVLVYPTTELSKKVNAKFGKIRVRSLTFSLDGNLKTAGQTFLDNLFRHPCKPKRSRLGWDEAFATMAERKDDVLLDDVSTTNWDQVEWEW